MRGPLCLPAFVVLGTLVLAAQAQFDAGRVAQRLEGAQARWAARRPANYEFVLSLASARDPWSLQFASYRLMGTKHEALIVPARSAGAPIVGLEDFDSQFNVVATSLAQVRWADFDPDLGYPRDVGLSDMSFHTLVFRSFSTIADVAGLFVLIQHLNHCGLGSTDPTDLAVCPDYSIALWGDGTVGYLGIDGVKTIGRREHRVRREAVRAVAEAIATSAVFNLQDDYTEVKNGARSVVTIDHNPEQWIVIRADGRTKTIHDFFGTPEAVKSLERAVERATDSHRYTGRDDRR